MLDNYEFVYYGLIDSAKSGATITADFDLQDGSSTESVKSDGTQSVEYGSLERDTYFPSRPRPLFSEQPAGIISQEQTGATGAFTTPLSITITFDGYYSFNGLTLYTKDLWTNFTVSVYQDDTLFSTKMFSADSKSYFANIIAEDCNKAVISIAALDKPYRFMQLYRFEVGKIETLTKTSIISAKVKKSVSLSTRENPLSTLDLTIMQDTVLRLFQDNQPIKVKKSGTEIFDFYVSNGVSKVDDNNQMKIKCYSAMNCFDGEFLGGMWESATAVTDILDSVFTNTGFDYALDEAFNGVTVTGYIGIVSRRDALTMIAAAIGAVIDDSLSTIRFRSISNVSSATFDKANVIKIDNKSETNQETKGIKFTHHCYSRGGDTVQVYNWYISTTEQSQIRFSQPLHSLKAYDVVVDANGTETKGGESSAVTFITREANYCIVENISRGKIIIEGLSYTDSKNEIEITNPRVNPNKAYKVENIEKITLISSAQSIAQSFYNFYLRNKKLVVSVLGDDATAIDRVTVLNNDYNIQSITSEFKGLTDLEVI